MLAFYFGDDLNDAKVQKMAHIHVSFQSPKKNSISQRKLNLVFIGSVC